MPVGKRAWLYVSRNKKRSVLLFLLLTALMTISLLGLALHAASKDAGKLLRSSIGGYFTIQSAADSDEKVDERLLQQVKTLDNISRYNGVDTYYLYTEGLQLMPGSNHGTGLVGEFMPKLIGCTDSSLHERFVAVSFQLKEGRHIQADDQGKAVISEAVAGRNHLSLGDTIHGSAVNGVRGWPPHAWGAEQDFEIVGIYTTVRNEPVSPSTPECDLQENIIFTDIAAAKAFYQSKFPDRDPEEYEYGSGIMLFLEDPAHMEETVAALKTQPYADWDGLILSENNAAYTQAAGPIQQIEVISLLLLLVILVLSVAILALILLLWTRERTTEAGILISMGLSPRSVMKQIILENDMVGAPAFLAAALLSRGISGILERWLGGLLQNICLADYIGLPQLAVVLLCAAAVIAVSVLLACIPFLRQKPREILTTLS